MMVCFTHKNIGISWDIPDISRDIHGISMVPRLPPPGSPVPSARRSRTPPSAGRRPWTTGSATWRRRRGGTCGRNEEILCGDILGYLYIKYLYINISVYPYIYICI